MPTLHPSFRPITRAVGAVATLLSLAICGAAPAAAQRIENQIAVFAALDKVTARISRLEVKLGETVQFGALQVTPRLCYSRPPDQPPKTTTFVEVQETQLDGSQKKLFSGWMFAESPGLDAVEHPVYDVWLTECMSPRLPPGRTPGPVAGAPLPGKPPAVGQPPAGVAASSGTEDDFRRRRPPR